MSGYSSGKLTFFHALDCGTVLEFAQAIIKKLLKHLNTDKLFDMEQELERKGTLSVDSDNIFPIIKKFLYSDHEIFLREIVSNAVDAAQKLKRLASMGEFKGELGELRVKVAIDKEAKTLTISDNGIGMSADEIEKYINRIAFSGAAEFVEKYKDKEDTQNIIGHFGLGFYSAFMVSSEVQLVTRSFRSENKEEATLWVCDGSTSFEMTSAVREERGTDVILHIAEDSEEFLEEARIKTILDKYGKFLPIEIEFKEEVINDPTPIWTRQPSELKDEDYKEFYAKLFPMSEEPLFHIHLNVDYPFNLTGVLYFPKIKNDFTVQKDKIQLYSRQVFITDEVKDIVPEFLTLLHGVIDSPDIPLNVSRSYLQSDGNVKKINNYITRKVADKLLELFNKDRKDFEEKWDKIGLFVEYGMLTQEKFYDKAEKFFLVKNTDGKLFTLNEYIEQIGPNQTNTNDQRVILYTHDLDKQYTFVQSAKKRGYDVLLMNSPLTSHFVQHLEAKLEKVSVKRVDADSVEKLIEKEEAKAELTLSEDEQTKLKELFEDVTGQKGSVQLEALPVDELPVSVTMPEFMRRMKEMSASSGFSMDHMPDTINVIINGNHSMINKILQTEDNDSQKMLARQAYDLALLSQGKLEGKALNSFIERSLELIEQGS